MGLIGAPPVFEMPARMALGRTGLLDVISRIPLDGEAAKRWAFGLTWIPWPCNGLQGLDVNCGIYDLDLTDAFDEFPEARSQPAFSLWDAIQCSTMGLSADELSRRIETHMAAVVSAAFAHELVTGDASGGHSLSVDAADVGSYDVPGEALAAVIDGLDAQLQGAEGIIHMTPGTLSRVVNHLVRDDDRDGYWQTAAGHDVVADAGYIDDSPDATIYGTGPVYYEADSFKYIGSATGPETIDFSHNLRTIFAERFGILVWDPCPVVKATTTIATA